MVTKHSCGAGNCGLAVATSPFGPLPAVWLNDFGECPDVDHMRPRLRPAPACPVLAASTVLGTAVTATPAVAAVTIDGPDVSGYQHPNGVSINWTKVAAEGHEFAIVKATEGTSYVNKYFAADYSGIRKAGMVRGSYHFARPAYPIAKTALAQAKFYVAHLGSVTTTKTLPPALDLEVGRRPRPHCAHHLGAELPARRAQPHRPHPDDLHLPVVLAGRAG